jgi:hypothetical protein
VTPETNSYSILIRDAVLDRVKVLPFFKNKFTFSRSKALPIQAQNIPYAGCYIVDETLTPDGDPNAGDIRFEHFLRLGFSVVIKNNDPDEVEDKLDGAFWSLMNGLLRDASLTNMLGAYDADGVEGFAIEGFTRGSRKNVYGNAGLNNEMAIAELQLELTCKYRTTWPPIIEDDLITIHTVTGFPLRGTAEERAKVQQVTAVYDDLQNAVDGDVLFQPSPDQLAFSSAPPILS